MTPLHVACEAPDENLLRAIGEGLRAHNIQTGGAPSKPEEFVVTLRDKAGALFGGMTCDLYLGGLLIEWAWIDKSRRGEGWGRALLAMAEREGAQRGAVMAHLDTFSFQARGFYERCGYAVFGALEYPNGIARYYLRKDLAASI